MDLTQWHVWSGRWIRRWDGTGQACTYVDGTEIGCFPTFDTTNQPMVLNFTIQGNGHRICTGCDATGRHPRPLHGHRLGAGHAALTDERPAAATTSAAATSLGPRAE